MSNAEPLREAPLCDRSRESGPDVELCRLLSEHILDFVRVHDVHGNSVYASRSVERLYGKLPERLFEFAHPDDLERCQRWWQNVIAGDSSERLRWRVRDKHGQWNWLESAATVVQFRARPHVLTVCRNITGQRQ